MRPAGPPSRTASLLRGITEGLLRLLYPPVCAGCGERAPHDEIPLCARCWARQERADPGEAAEQVAHLPASSGVLDDAFALWIFDAGSPMRRVHHLLKYGGRPRYGSALGEQLGAALAEAAPARPRPDLVLPVPLHRIRLLERGYNQSALLAHGVALAFNVPCREDVLVRRRATRTQTRLSREERWANVQGAFELSAPEAVAGRRVLLVDDVLTTGATLCAAARALREGGASGVDAAALAFARQ